ncbi:hypothetical protein SAMN05444143_10660 [Flavobacterium succinicans]|uniref:Uncharacterized protein n=1 Tax=Flavobacterium succinicans TaxID=29536 RepID=A0A1I4W7J1_9FLAO|nr:hypothetical protein [Flavobacterium succinicans]SFN09327.1 hypothetical protein SAMN05444143_10660 [Flavobacterium succinicans]
MTTHLVLGEYSNLIVVFVSGLVPTLLTLYLNERVKGSVKNSFDEKIEKLKNEHSKELSQFQTELNHLKSKENFKFTKLHEKRFEVLQESFKYLNTNLNLLGNHISPFKFTAKGEDFDQNEQKASKEYREAHNEFLQYFNFNSIYFDEETEILLLSFFRESGEIFNAYDQRQIYKSMGEKLETEDRLASAFTYKKIPEIIHPLKKEIELKFRELLGE